MKKRAKKPAKELRKKASGILREHPDLYIVRVGSAGIGRLGFRAYFDDERIERGDGDDGGTFETPGQALAALGQRLDEMLVKEAWHWRRDGLPDMVREEDTESSKYRNTYGLGVTDNDLAAGRGRGGAIRLSRPT